MSVTTMTRVGDTRLYEPVGPVGEYGVFLLWGDVAPAPTDLAVADTWSDAGPPAHVGWYVFTDVAIRDASFEAALRAALPAPHATGFAWASGAAGAPHFSAKVALTAVRDGPPVVVDDVAVHLADGFLGLAFAAGAPVRAVRNASDEISGLAFGYPAGDELPPSVSGGIVVSLDALTIGTIEFSAMQAAAVKQHESGAVKSLVDVRLDPVRPFNHWRTRTTLTGRDLAFVPEDGHYRLVPLAEAPG